MSSVEACGVRTLERLLAIAKKLGFELRYENLVEAESGSCQIGSKRILILDLNQTTEEILEVVRATIEQDPRFSAMQSTIQSAQPAPIKRAA